MIAAPKQIGTPLKINFPNISTRSSSLTVLNTKLPPEENGDIAVACAPITIAENNTAASIPEASAKLGTSGNNAGVTTPIVLEKNDINPPIAAITIGTTGAGIVSVTNPAINFTVPAFIATDINIPTPQIMINVPHGTFFMTSFSSPKFINKARTAKTTATKPTSIALSRVFIRPTYGKIMCKIGKINTTTIIDTTKANVFF